MPAAESERRWFHLSPDRFVIGLLLVICLLWLSERYQWFGFNHHKGWTVLIAVAAVGVATVVILLWWSVGLIFARRFQFGIRSLLAFCLASSIAIGWLATEMRHARRQADVVNEMMTFGEVGYDWQFDSAHEVLPNAEQPGPVWLRNPFGIDFFSAVVEVDFGGAKTTDAELEQLKDLTQLEVLDVASTRVTDAGLKHLESLTKLQGLNLTDTQITDAGLDHLKGLTQLKALHLNGTKITDAGLECLKGLTQLQVLDIDGDDITDAGLKQIEGLTQLELLWLYNTRVTDVGLEQLKSMHNLQRLWLNDTGVTDAGVKMLQQALPNCDISR